MGLARLLSALVLSCLLAPGGPAHALDAQGGLRVTGRLLADSNAPRGFSDGQAPAPVLDAALHVALAGEGRLTGEAWQLVGRYEGGLRKYNAYAPEDTGVQVLALEASHALGPVLAAGLEARAKDRRGGSREYSDLGAGAFLEYAADARLALRVRAGAHRFVYRPFAGASFGGPEVGLVGRYRLDRRHQLSLSGEWGLRRHGMEAWPAPGVQGEPTRRVDGALAASVSYTYRGPVALGLTYGFQELASNSYGQTVLRHRLSGSAGVRLPWRLTLLAQGALGLSHFPDGLYLSPDIILLEEDEGQNQLSVRLARPVDAHLDVELAYGLYSTRLPRNGLAYFRQVLGVGFTWRL